MYEDLFAKRLSQLRLQKNISAREMSLELGQNSSYINRIENNKAYPSMLGFFYICEFFKISPEEFFDENNMNPQKLKDIIEDLKYLNDYQLTCIKAIISDLRKLNDK